MDDGKLHEKMRRLRQYSKGHKRYRCSRNIARPVKIVKPRAELEEALKDYELQSRVTYEVLAVDENGEVIALLNEISKEVFTRRR